MKLLWVKSGSLVPLDTGGKIRSFNLLKELARRHEVTLFTFYAEQPDDTHRDLEQYFHRVIALPFPIPEAGSAGDYLNYATNLFSTRPYSMSKYCKPWVAAQLREHLLGNSYDVIVCDFLLTAAVIPWNIPTPVVLFTHNVEAIIWRRHFEVSRNPVWKAVSWREWYLLDQFERRMLARAESVLTVSENDKRIFAEFVDPAKIAVVQTGVDLDYFHPSAEPELPRRLVFTGSMDWMPNEDGITYFVEEVYPLVRREIPDVELWVVGRKPSEKLKALAGASSGVHVTGTVDDIRPYVWQSTVYVVPLRIGGGTRIKIFEALAMGKAVVSTTIGAEGLPITHGEHLILADTPSDFARETLRLMRDPAARAHLGSSARRLLEQHYGWGAVAEDFTRVLDRTVAAYATRRGAPSPDPVPAGG